MYFVDREKIEATLVFFDEHVRLFTEHSSWNTEIEKKALERIVHLLIENVLDVGNAMIDGFIMRDPGSYDDIIDSSCFATARGLLLFVCAMAGVATSAQAIAV